MVIIVASAVFGGTVAAVGPFATAGTTDGAAEPSTAPATFTAPADAQAAGQQLAQTTQRPRSIDFLRVRSIGDGEYAYRFRVRGYVQKTRVNDGIKSESNDVLRRNDDGTVTVTGTTGNGLSDAYVVVGEIVSFRKIRGHADGELTLNGLELTRDELLNTETVEVVSRDEGEEVRYEIRVRGPVERVETEEAVAGDDDDRIVRNDDGTRTIRGVTGDQTGDAFRVRGEVLSFERTGGDSRLTLRLNGLEVDPETLGAGPGEPPDDGDGDNGDDDDGDDGDVVTRIDDCTVIDEPGSYVLTGNVRNADEDACIEVTVDGVTIDGDGHGIDGVDSDGSVGIAIVAPEDERFESVTVTDVVVTDWGTGIDVDGGEATTLRDVTLRDVVSRSNVDTGIHLVDAAESRVDGARVRDNGLTGILLEDSGLGNVVTGSTVGDNGAYGIVVFDGGRGTEVRDNTVRRNGRGGIATSNGETGTEISGNVVTLNDGNGISLSDSDAPEVRGNRITGNDASGVSLADVREGSVAENRVAGNGVYGISLRFVRTTNVSENVVRGNSDSGISVERSRENTVTRNVVCENGEPQISVGAESSDNEIADNRLTC
ncbi:right-handed parallel beta-helix repeat-containing protein [Halolamina litorea]|uniref:right-handed parallel beta-helix repeat-containing protein n=1 Tax=Halolamina litorea TaxID=1515593 RepID=UPI002270793A|nr:NosD domain-containing protein [Halolamina litorea]